MKRIILTLLLLLSAIVSADTKDEQVIELTNFLTGTFSNSEQVKLDSSYIDLTLKITEIWKDSSNGSWLYLETAFSSDPDDPYKKQIYHISKTELSFILIDIYKITDIDKFVSSLIAKKFDSSFNSLIESINNCEIYIHRQEKNYIGFSKSNKCPSKIRRASYSNTDIEISEKDFYIWERGFNQKDELVWGPKDGGYDFKKISNSDK